ncbi:AMP-binding enzyme [Homoserinimonas sp. A447]
MASSVRFSCRSTLVWPPRRCRAVLTLGDGGTFDEQALRAHLKDNIAHYKIPKRFIVVDGLPSTESGKIRKAELRLKYHAEAEAAGRPADT